MRPMMSRIFMEDTFLPAWIELVLAFLLLGCAFALEGFNYAISGLIWVCCLGRVSWVAIYEAPI